MKHMILIAAIALCGTVMISCNGSKGNESEVAVQADTIANEKPPILVAAERYLADSIAPNYAPGEHCIPIIPMTCVDGADTTDVKVWGSFWVFNYNVVGDTLKCVSGGDHSGLMHLRKVGDAYEVFAFEQVEDGAGNEASARKIFGDYYDAYQAVNGDETYREKARHDAIAEYVKENALAVKCYQDYGWPAVNL